MDVPRAGRRSGSNTIAINLLTGFADIIIGIALILAIRANMVGPAS
jgi:hypothetical protein